ESVLKIFPAISYELRACYPYSNYYCFLPGVLRGKSSGFGKVLRWRFLTNVMIPIAKVSATGRPITSSDAVGLLSKKQGIHIDDADTVRLCEDVATFLAASVTVNVVT